MLRTASQLHHGLTSHAGRRRRDLRFRHSLRYRYGSHRSRGRSHVGGAYGGRERHTEDTVRRDIGRRATSLLRVGDSFIVLVRVRVIRGGRWEETAKAWNWRAEMAPNAESRNAGRCSSELPRERMLDGLMPSLPIHRVWNCGCEKLPYNGGCVVGFGSRLGERREEGERPGRRLLFYSRGHRSGVRAGGRPGGE